MSHRDDLEAEGAALSEQVRDLYRAYRRQDRAAIWALFAALDTPQNFLKVACGLTVCAATLLEQEIREAGVSPDAYGLKVSGDDAPPAVQAAAQMIVTSMNNDYPTSIALGMAVVRQGPAETADLLHALLALLVTAAAGVEELPADLFDIYEES